MFDKSMQRLGEERSTIRELFEYAAVRKAQIGAENVFDFSIGNPASAAPECVREEIERLLKTVPPQVLHGYTSAAGDCAARRSVAEYLRRAFGAPASEELVYLTCGASSALAVVMRALCEAGDEFVVIAPFFPEYRVFIEAAGGRVAAAQTGKDFHLDLDELDRAIGAHTKAVVVNSPNNPTGAVYGEEELRLLGALLEKKSSEKGSPVFLISDEPYRELVYAGSAPHPANYYANTVELYSFSKSLSLAGERIGYIAVSPRCAASDKLFAAVCGAGRSLGYVCAPALFQRVTAACLGRTSDLSLYRNNRDALLSALTEYGFSCTPPEGAFYLFLRSPEPDAQKFCARARRHELLFVPSDSFGTAGYVRIAYCVPSEVVSHSLKAFRRLAAEYF